jgi:chromosome segregation ATPase
MTNSQYKSPAHKLINFFKNSRDNWKATALEYNKKIRSLTEMLRQLRHRRDELKAENKELRRQVKKLDKELQRLANSFQNNSLKKRETIILEQNPAQIHPNSNTHLQAEISLKPANHRYNASVISMDRYLVTRACSSFRAVGKSLKVINNNESL